MGNHPAPLAIVVVSFVMAICVLTPITESAQAQQPVPPSPGNRDPFAEARERQQREAQLRRAELVGGVKKTDQRGAEAAAEQMRVDFKSIQILRNKLARHLLSDKPLDYKFIAGESEEINKRASRLKTHLMREALEDREKDQEKQVEIGDSRMKESLITMCKRIDSFTENPIFKVPDVIDIEQSAKAGRDLRDIIHLSGSIKRTAERLRKAPKK